jgi:hypothetical protein
MQVDQSNYAPFKVKEIKMKKMVLLALVSMFLSITAVAHATKVFPFVEGMIANYSATQGTNTWECESQITGTVELGTPSYLWAIMQLSNWMGTGDFTSQNVRCTNNTMYEYSSTASIQSNPIFQIPPKGSSSWTYTDIHGNTVTATIESIGTVTVPAGTYENVYEVTYIVPSLQNESAYWAPGVGLIKDVDNLQSPPITRVLTSNPFEESLVGTWTGGMNIVVPNDPTVETGTVTVEFLLVDNATQAYTGTLAFTPVSGTGFSMSFSAIRGPFDPTQLHISAPGVVILGELRRQANHLVVDLHGSDTSGGYTYVSLGLSKK